MTRPEDLPDFKTPPLNEVVLGIQFAPAAGYQQIRAGEVWALFKDRFPYVEEHPPLPPMFETFGLPQTNQINVGIVTGATHDRFWFLSPEKEELIQFQHDRLLHNWRKLENVECEYPRFEKMIEKFESESMELESYFSKLAPQTLNINQCEISYINHIVDNNNSTRIDPDKWIKFVDFKKDIPEDFAFNFRHVIQDEHGNSHGRLLCTANAATAKSGSRVLVLTLQVRGAPTGTDTKAAMDFLKMGREVVVKYFASITTDSAHEIWERVQ